MGKTTTRTMALPQPHYDDNQTKDIKGKYIAENQVGINI